MKKIVALFIWGMLIFGSADMAGAVSFSIGPNGPSGNHWQLGTGWGDGSGQLLAASFYMNDNLPSVSFPLASVGDHATFRYGAVILDEPFIDATETDGLDVTAWLNFLLPPGVGLEGNPGIATAIVGAADDSETDLTITFAQQTVAFNGGTFIVDLSDIVINSATSPNNGMNVYATVTLASVPEPATMILLGLGLIGLAGVRTNLRK